jgi:hypothetical protein
MHVIDNENFHKRKEEVLEDLKKSRTIVAISISEDGKEREHYFNATQVERIYLAELIKHQALREYFGDS